MHTETMSFVRAVQIIFFILFYSFFAAGQVLTNSDTLARSNAIYLAKQIYQSAIFSNSQVFNGVEYIDPFQKKKLDGNPYFLNNDWQDGFVVYENQLYENLSLRYNLFQNKLLIEHNQSHATIELFNEKIKSFGISRHIFVWLTSAADQSEIKEGFYDLLYSGTVKVYARRYKTMSEVIDPKIIVTKFVDKTKLFLFKNDQYFSITNKNSALNAFGEVKIEIKKFLSHQKINFRSDPEMALTAMARYYDELKK